MICDKHKKNPARGYSPCAGCEVEHLQEEVAKLKRDTPRWIPCTEQLPDSDTTVMTFAPDSNEPIWPAYHDGEEWVDLNGGPITDAEVTHWMPFPEPPKQR